MRKIEASVGSILIAGAFLLTTEWWPTFLILGICLVGDGIIGDEL